jgi:hypothetical protein
VHPAHVGSHSAASLHSWVQPAHCGVCIVYQVGTHRTPPRGHPPRSRPM